MKALLLAAACLTSTLAHGHGGGLDSDGCHTNRKTGDYHCHRGSGGSRPAESSKALGVQPARQQPGSPTCYTGPRGGTYTITKTGRKNYSGC
jgi:hypothetical protein